MSEISLDDLPVELIYRIFDKLDGKTILFNVRSVCKRFYSIANNYNRYTIDLRSLRMIEFEIFCKKFSPENIKKLIISNDEKTVGSIRIFLTKFNFEQFINIRYLIISNIEDRELEIILKQLENHNINELSIIKLDICYNKNLKYNLFSKILTRPNLLKLDLEFHLADAKDFPWPIQCPIEYLRIGNTITINQYYTILDQTPFLKTLILKNCENKESNSLPRKVFKQLNSLTFEFTRMTIDELQLVLSYTPSINYLKIIGTNSLSDGIFLENLLENNLQDLKSFQFYFDCWNNPTEEDFHSIIFTYQSTFWTQQKHWFINCDYYVFTGNTKMRLYSLPLFYHKYEFDTNDPTYSFTTANHLDSKDSVTQLSLDFTVTIPTSRYQRDIETSIIFPNVTELKLIVDEQWPRHSFEFLLTLVNLLNIHTLTVNAVEKSDFTPGLIKNLCELLKRAKNVDTFTFTSGQSPLSCNITLEHIFQIVPKHVKHLKVMVNDFDEIRIIIDKLEHLSSVIFKIVRVMARCFAENRLSIIEKRKGTICQKMDPCLNMWLGKANTNINYDNE